MLCPHCERQISVVNRVIVAEVVVSRHPVSDEGVAGPACPTSDNLCVMVREYAEGLEGTWYICPCCNRMLPDVTDQADAARLGTADQPDDEDPVTHETLSYRPGNHPLDH